MKDQSDVVDHVDNEAETYTAKRRKSGERSKILKKKSKKQQVVYSSTMDLCSCLLLSFVEFCFCIIVCLNNLVFSSKISCKGICRTFYGSKLCEYWKWNYETRVASQIAMNLCNCIFTLIFVKRIFMSF
jgi:hypothetical protein